MTEKGGLPEKVVKFKGPDPEPVSGNDSLTGELAQRVDVDGIMPVSRQTGPVVFYDAEVRRREIENALKNMRRDRFAGDSIYQELLDRKEQGEL